MTDSGPRRAKLFRILQTQAGISRRKALDLVASGEVAVDGATVADPFLVLDPDSASHLTLRGHPLSLEPLEPRVYRFHKPAGVLCSHDDPHCGDTVGRVLRAEGFVGYTWVGRLDQDAEGLLLLSNDGALVQAFSHPRYEVRKTYRVWLDRIPPRPELESALREMERGIEDAGERLRILDGRVEGRPAHAVVTLAEGRKHEVKRLFASRGLAVTRLLRVSVGPIELGDLAPGGSERLAPALERELLATAHQLIASVGEPGDD